MTKVVNLRTYRSNDYILIDRRTPFGCPFRIGPDGTRADVVRKHKEWLNEWIQNKKEIIISRWSNKWVIEHLEVLRDFTIACWCKPLACHGDNLVAILEGEDDQI